MNKGKAHVEQHAAKIVQGNDRDHQIQSKSDRQSIWVVLWDQASEYLKSRGVKTPEMRDPKISCGICIRSWPEFARSDG